jgi:GAF domain-containing protein
MLKDNEFIGIIAICRQEVRPFTDKQVALLTNFAAQAVIAIENARLLNELRESLEQQTATSEVLGVISSSTGDLEPVFRAILESAAHICGAKFGALSLREGDVFRAVASHGASPAFVELRRREPLIRPTPGHNLERLLRTKQVIHVPDLSSDRDAAPVPFELAGARALLNVPLLKDNELIGSILIYRQEAGPFSNKQIALVQSFAAQAVIAIENTRLLNELRESLQQQTATAEVLRVISSSLGDLQPVFETILASAARISESNFGTLQLCEGQFYRQVAWHNPPPAFVEARRQNALIAMSGETVLARVARTKRWVQVADVANDPAYQIDAQRRRFVSLTGVRSNIAVPMLKDN